MANDKSKKPIDKIAEQLASNLIEQFSSVDRWKQTWKEIWNLPTPYNAATENRYRGYNSLSLLLSGLDQGFSDPRWMTYKQAKDAGYQVRKDERSTYIGFFNATPVTPDTYIPKGLRVSRDDSQKIKDHLQALNIKTWGDLLGHERPSELILAATGKQDIAARASLLLDDIKQEKAVDIVFRSYAVFNAEQIEGIPELEDKGKNRDPIQDLTAIENILDNSGVRIIIDGRTNPAYYPTLDTITMPPPEQFGDAYLFYSAYAHEMSHATAHENRLDRPTPDYAKEELVAELSSMLIASNVGLQRDDKHFDNHAAYLKSWSEMISDDPRELFSAVREAGKSAEYVIGLAEEPDKYINPERLKFNEKRQTEGFYQFKDSVIKAAEARTISPQKAASSIAKARIHGLRVNERKNENITEIEP